MPSTDRPNADDARPHPDTEEGANTEEGGEPAFRDAEAWLAEQGIRREPLIISTPGDQPGPDAEDRPSRQQGQQPPAPPPIGSEAPPDQEATGAQDPDVASADPAGETDGPPSGREPGRLEDQVSEAAAYARRATANTPLSEARLRSKLESRGYLPPVVTQAMQRARDERIVDDHAYAMALVREGRDKGHAPLRIKTDMQKRDLSDEAIQAALDTIGDRDPEAQAFAVARKRAERYRNVDTETAYRRLVSYLARRGYTEALSRKVARQAVFNDREPQRIAER